ncbi:unnamed protein product [Ixodes pacificus]
MPSSKVLACMGRNCLALSTAKKARLLGCGRENRPARKVTMFSARSFRTSLVGKGSRGSQVAPSPPLGSSFLAAPLSGAVVSARSLFWCGSGRAPPSASVSSGHSLSGTTNPNLSKCSPSTPLRASAFFSRSWCSLALRTRTLLSSLNMTADASLCFTDDCKRDELH